MIPFSNFTGNIYWQLFVLILRKVRKYANLTFGRHLLCRIMSSGKSVLRYFPNNSEDYRPGSEIFVYKDGIKNSVLQSVDKILRKFPPTAKNAADGLYIGTAGVAYMLYYASKFEAFAEQKEELLNKSLEYIKPALFHVESATPTDKCSFLLGASGVYAVAAAIYNAKGDKSKRDEFVAKYVSLRSTCMPKRFLKCGADEFFVGRSGFLSGVFWLQRELDIAILSPEEIYEICDVIVQSGREYAETNNSPCPLMYSYYKTEYLGAAHGISFILQMLISTPEYVSRDKSVYNDIKRSVDYILSLQTKDGNYPSALDELGHNARSEIDELVHWCHGAPGIVYLMAKAYMVFGDEKYLNSCIKSGELVWTKGLLRKGPGICHGVAGNGYIFLLLHRLTSEPKYLHRAVTFANFLNTDDFHRGARTPDCPYSLYEGDAGTVCFLTDLLYPDSAEFPFQDVFIKSENVNK